MGRFVEGANRNQATLLPECLEDFIAEDNPVRIVDAFVDELDLASMGFYPILDPIAALIVGLLVFKMGWQFGWDALHDLMDCSADEHEVTAVRQTLLATPGVIGVIGVHDLRTRKMGDMIVADVHVMTHVDPRKSGGVDGTAVQTGV
jgi:Co/Zn/Cd efflux system component